MVLKVNVGSGFHLEALQSVLSLGNSNIVLSHCASPFQICGNEAEILLSRAAASGEMSAVAACCQRFPYSTDFSEDRAAIVLLTVSLKI